MSEPTPRWSVNQAADWYAARPWPIGVNFYPSTAGNQLEMWQDQTFDLPTIDRELGYAAAMGMNCMRVYLHDLLFHHDRDSLFERMESYLSTAHTHRISTLFVLFDDCWCDDAQLGPQPEPLPGVHNSIWLRCPAGRGAERAQTDAVYRETLKDYVTQTLHRFRDDDRIFGWDLYNEPEQDGRHVDRDAKGQRVAWDFRPMGSRSCHALVHHAFDWAQHVDPSQPLTVGAHRGRFHEAITRTGLCRSDIASFHCYGDAERLHLALADAREHVGDRPLLCTEYMGRTAGSTFQACLPVLHDQQVGALSWGLVAGRSNTIYPWTSWDQPGRLPEPEVWFHDILRSDGSPYDPAEVELIQRLAKASES